MSICIGQRCGARARKIKKIVRRVSSVWKISAGGRPHEDHRLGIDPEPGRVRLHPRDRPLCVADHSDDVHLRTEAIGDAHAAFGLIRAIPVQLNLGLLIGSSGV